MRHAGRSGRAGGLPLRPGIWHPGLVTFWLALRRLLPLLAVLSLALIPVTAPAATAAMHASSNHGAPHHHGMDMAGMNMPDMDVADMDMDAMPCCPKAEPASGSPTPDCAKGCPLMALCLASVASLLPSAVPMPAPVGRRTSLSWPEPAPFASVQKAPLPEPPRA